MPMNMSKIMSYLRSRLSITNPKLTYNMTLEVCKGKHQDGQKGNQGKKKGKANLGEKTSLIPIFFFVSLVYYCFHPNF